NHVAKRKNFIYRKLAFRKIRYYFRNQSQLIRIYPVIQERPHFKIVPMKKNFYLSFLFIISFPPTYSQNNKNISCAQRMNRPVDSKVDGSWWLDALLKEAPNI